MASGTHEYIAGVLKDASYQIVFDKVGIPHWHRYGVTNSTTSTPDCIEDVFRLARFWIEFFTNPDGHAAKFKDVLNNRCPPDAYSFLSGPFFIVLVCVVIIGIVLLYILTKCIKDVLANSKKKVIGVEAWVLLNEAIAEIRKCSPKALAATKGPASRVHAKIVPIDSEAKTERQPSDESKTRTADSQVPIEIGRIPDFEPLDELENLKKLRGMHHEMQGKDELAAAGLETIIQGLEQDITDHLEGIADRVYAKVLQESGTIPVLERIVKQQQDRILHPAKERDFFAELNLPIFSQKKRKVGKYESDAKSTVDIEYMKGKLLSWARQVAKKKGETAEKLQLSCFGNFYMGLTGCLMPGCVFDMVKFLPDQIRGAVEFITDAHCLKDISLRVFRPALLCCFFKPREAEGYACFNISTYDQKMERLRSLVRGKLARGAWYRCGQCTGYSVPAEISQLLDKVIALRKEINALPKAQRHTRKNQVLRSLLTNEMIEDFLEDYYDVISENTNYLDDMWRPLVMRLNDPDLLERDRMLLAARVDKTTAAAIIESQSVHQHHSLLHQPLISLPSISLQLGAGKNEPEGPWCACCCRWRCQKTVSYKKLPAVHPVTHV